MAARALPKPGGSDFPGDGMTLEFGPEIPTSGPPGSVGPGVNMVVSMPLWVGQALWA